MLFYTHWLQAKPHTGRACPEVKTDQSISNYRSGDVIIVMCALRARAEHRCHGTGSRQGFTLFTDSEVRHVRCDYVMHFEWESWCVRNTEKQGEGEIYVNAPAK